MVLGIFHSSKGYFGTDWRQFQNENGIWACIGQRSKSGTSAYALDRLGRDYDGIISEWKYITQELNADIFCLDNETLFDSRKFKTMGDFGKVMEDNF